MVLSHWRSGSLLLYAERFDWKKRLNEMLRTKGMGLPINLILVCIR